jgi:hypothetical protein
MPRRSMNSPPWGCCCQGAAILARSRVRGRRRLERSAPTRLMDAAEKVSAEVVEALLAAGADPAASDSRGSGWYLERTGS